MPTIIERRLALDFPDDWQVVAYDRRATATEPASFYRRLIEKGGVQHVRGMDIVCRLPDAAPSLQLIEVKNDRGSDQERGPRHAALFITVMQKTAGTLAGLLLAERLADRSLSAQACLGQNPAIRVVLFLVEPDQLPELPDSPENHLHRLVRRERAADLDQRLTAKLDQWGIPFSLYNLTNRPPHPWQVRDLGPPPASAAPA